ncbi:hypothetical protein Zmor_014631 [Zophobas morio]|uniref:Uncharacterized protein n=1 Tax=Zophobas morio TaxID=2755281 RepID=A0AA38IHY5_9CUCU|nr:hypothetical protein Zmor_014631 [Zophobas morio]
MKLVLFLVPPILATIDLNFAELEYLASHLLPEECRRLVAAAHFKAYMMPNAVGQAAQAIPKDVPCIQLLLHWNSADGEGRGETHEVLEHRLRQMGKYELADWLGRTVFHQLGEDLQKSLHAGLGELANETTTTPRNISVPTLSPTIEYEDPREWLPFDTICLAVLGGLVVLTISVCVYVTCVSCCRRLKKPKKRVLGKSEYYEMVEDASNSESEDKFDIRQHETTM